MPRLLSLSPSTAKRCRIRRPCTSKGSRAMSSLSRKELNPLFDYTSGRWLWDEDEQLAARHRYFDVPGLQRVACQAVGAKTCNSIVKIGEGGSNKAYRLEIKDGRNIIAKIPYPIAGPAVLTTSSEVATMEFARDILGLPAPKVLAWSATDDNPVQAEYIIMEEAKGSQLSEVWENLPLRKKVDVILEIVEIEKKMLSVSFDRLGSLYFKGSGIEGCEPANAENLTKDMVNRIASRYCIGPITRSDFWERKRGGLHLHGPWTSAVDYLKSIANREIAWIESYGDLPKSFATSKPTYRGFQERPPAAHLESLRDCLAAIPLITPRDPELTSARLWHPDLHLGNIYVDDEARISSIIDWQGTWTAPVFIGANPPAILDYGTEMLMKLPDDFKTFDDATRKQIKHQVAQSILIHKYETSTAKANPLMYKMMRHPHGKTLKHLEAFIGTTWDSGLLRLEEILIQIEREWSYFGVEEPCPYHISKNRLEHHYENADMFNKAQEWWAGLQGILTAEGFTSNETFDAAVEAWNEVDKFAKQIPEAEEMP